MFTYIVIMPQNSASLIVCSVPVIATTCMYLRPLDSQEASVPENRTLSFFVNHQSKAHTSVGGTKFSTIVLSDTGDSTNTGGSSFQTLGRFEDRHCMDLAKRSLHDEPMDLHPVVQDISSN
jgi:hypothetical protein